MGGYGDVFVPTGVLGQRHKTDSHIQIMNGLIASARSRVIFVPKMMSLFRSSYGRVQGNANGDLSKPKKGLDKIFCADPLFPSNIIFERDEPFIAFCKIHYTN